MLSVDSVSVYYGNIRALWEVTIQVGQGEVVSVVGSNGAGKSTLLRSIMGLVRITGGSIRLREEEISSDRPHRIVSKGVSYVPEGRRLFPMMTVEENMRIAAPRSCADIRDRVGELFAMFPVLDERRSTLAGRLSGGEQQMVAIGRALIARPDLLLVDEPSFGLSPVVCDRVFQALKALARGGTAVLLAEQNQDMAFEISDRTYVFENGRTVLSGDSRELRDDPRVRSAYLGVAV